MFPTPIPTPTKPCARCGVMARVDRMVKGYGRACAERLGLTGGTVDTGQIGPDLFAAAEEEDHCDGWDHPAG